LETKNFLVKEVFVAWLRIALGARVRSEEDLLCYCGTSRRGRRRDVGARQPRKPLWCATAKELLTREGRWDKKEITSEVGTGIEREGGKRRGEVEKERGVEGV